MERLLELVAVIQEGMRLEQEAADGGEQEAWELLVFNLEAEDFLRP
jgi:hypothetical protein